MKTIAFTLSAVFLAAAVHAEGLNVKNAYVPEAPPGVMSHAAFMTLENEGAASRSLVGVDAEGYGMVHLHLSEEKDGVATMSMIHQLEIDAGKTVELAPGGFHIMLMHPKGMSKVGDVVPISLTFANGEVVSVDAMIKSRNEGS